MGYGHFFWVPYLIVLETDLKSREPDRRPNEIAGCSLILCPFRGVLTALAYDNDAACKMFLLANEFN